MKSEWNNSLSAEALIDKADKLFGEEKYKEAEALYFKGLEIINNIEDVAESDRYLRNAYAGLGDCFLLKNDYECAKNYFLKAHFYDSANPYINLRIGMCYAFLDNEAMAKEYLIQAYIMAGEDIFSEDKPFLDIIRDMIS